MKTYTKFAFSIAAAVLLTAACSDEKKTPVAGFPNDVTFNTQENSLDIEVPKLGFVIPDASYTAKAYEEGSVTLNVKKNSDGTHTGFALSNKNYRSYPWSTSSSAGSDIPDALLKSSIDSSIFSVYTTYPNQCKNFTVCRVSGDDAYFTLDKPRVVEHILVANTTYDFMVLSYGSRYSSALNKVTQVYDEKASSGKAAVVANPNLPDGSSKKYRVWYLPDYYKFNGGNDYVRLAGQQNLAKAAAGHAAAEKARRAGKDAAAVEADSTAAAAPVLKAWVKLIAKGYNGGNETGSSEYYIATLTGNAPVPYDTWNIVQPTWAAWDLSGLGVVDKVVFYMESSDTDASGRMKTPPYFCMDGIRLKK